MLDGFTLWPDEFAKKYRDEGYWEGETLDGLLRSVVDGSGDRIAVIDGVRRMTYAELDAAVDASAATFLGAGIECGNTVVVQLTNSVEFVTAFFGLQRLGAIPVLVLPAHRKVEIVHFCHISKAAAYVLHGRSEGGVPDDLATTVKDEIPDLKILYAEDFGGDGEFEAVRSPEPSDVAVLLVSGGTTGLPKLIPRTHDDYLYNARTSARLVGLGSDDVYLVSLPAAHNFALACPGILGAFSVSATVVMAKSVAPDEAFELIQEHGVTVTALVPAAACLWAEAAEWLDEDLTSMRLIQVGGSRLLPENAQMLREVFGRIIQQVYGMAEGLLNLTELDSSDEIVDITQGRPISPDDELRIIDESGADVPEGSIGQLITRGPYTLRGYFRAPEHNRSAFTPDGFYRTGDLVRRMPSGHLVVEGRVKDQINRGGEKIVSAEIEELLVGHPSVTDAAVIGMPDDMLGERSRAFVVAAGSAASVDRAELRTYLTERGVAAFKIPDDVIILESFPVTAVGKTDKRALAELIVEEKPNE